MSDADIAAQAAALLKATTISYPQWVKNVNAGKYSPQDGSSTNWGKAFAALSQIGAPPTPTPPPGTYRPFSSSSAFNTPIPASPPIHPDSAAMISTSTTWLYPGSYQEWLGPRDRVYYQRASYGSIPTAAVTVNYSDSSGYGCGRAQSTVPMPSGWSNLLGSNPASYDRITWITDPSNGNVWEGYRVTPPGTASMDVSCDSSRWNAVRMDNFPGEEKTGLGYGHGVSASGSGILCGAGLLIPDDFADQSLDVIPHALRGNWNVGSDGSGTHPAYVSPASGGDGRQPGGIPMGARVQLDPAFDVSGDSRWWMRLLGRTLQKYGIVGVDSSGCPGCGGIEAAVEASVAPYTFPWHGIGDYSRGIPYAWMSHFRVIDWRQWTGA